MALNQHPGLEISEDLIEAIRSLPIQREVEHCGTRLAVSPFAIYAHCPHCGTRIKIRSFSGVTEIEDVFDAVFEWMNQPMATEAAEHRRAELRAEE